MTEKTGAVRTYTSKKVRHVETMPCPVRDQEPHELTNTGPLTHCLFCGTPWAVLDQQARRTR